MSSTENNDPAPTATVPQILARLILLGQGLDLPDPKSMDAHADHMRVEIRVRDRAAFNSWIAAIGGGQADVQGPGVPRSDGTALWWALVWEWHAGWRVSVEFADTVAKPLDADTVAGLEEIAAGSEPDDDRVEVEETSLTLDQVDGYPVGRAAAQAVSA